MILFVKDNKGILFISGKYIEKLIHELVKFKSKITQRLLIKSKLN